MASGVSGVSGVNDHSGLAAAKAAAKRYHAERTRVLKEGGEHAWMLVMEEREAELMAEAMMNSPYRHLHERSINIPN